jgi:YbgC/YbaW family acyl-CoA thioester hydrolase
MVKVVHSREIHVALGDVDAAQVIYFPSVFRWHEYNFSEWLATQFMPLSKIFASGFGLPVVSCSATYSAAIHQDDRMTLQSSITDVGTSSFTFSTRISNEGTEAATVETRHVWVEIASNGTFSSVEIPADLRAVLHRTISPGGV